MGRTEKYQYTPLGLLVSKTDRNNQVTTYTYDFLDRQIKTSISVPCKKGTLTNELEITYYSNGKKKKSLSRQKETGVPTVELSSAFTYNSKGQLVTQTDPDGVTKTFGYNLKGQRESFTLTRQSIQEIDLCYQYDEAGRLTTLRQGNLSGLVLATYQYDAAGNRTSLAYPQSNVQTLYSYNNAGMVISLENRDANGTISKFNYTYDLTGNRLTEEENGKTTTYTYDMLGRLTREAHPGYSTLDYSYDDYSNRIQMKSSGGESYTTIYKYDHSNRLLTENKADKEYYETTVYTYDANGNQLSSRWQRVETKTPYSPTGFLSLGKGTKSGKPAKLDTREYNGLGQLVRCCRDATLITYLYRPDGLRYTIL